MAVVWAWLQRPWFAVLAIGVVIVAVVAVRYWRRRSRVVGDEASSELPRDPH